jgi:hypothetical protein
MLSTRLLPSIFRLRRWNTDWSVSKDVSRSLIASLYMKSTDRIVTIYQAQPEDRDAIAEFANQMHVQSEPACRSVGEFLISI